MEQYEIIYGYRLMQNSRKYAQAERASQVIKKRTLNVKETSQEEITEHIIQEFYLSHSEELIMKTRKSAGI